MKNITVQEIRSFSPCYDPTKYLKEYWQGTVIDLLDRKEIPFSDRLWVICRTDFISEKLMRLFAVWCARQVQHLMTDPRSLHALDVAERFAKTLKCGETPHEFWIVCCMNEEESCLDSPTRDTESEAVKIWNRLTLKNPEAWTISYERAKELGLLDDDGMEKDTK